jgi:hypothetical protein
MAKNLICPRKATTIILLFLTLLSIITLLGGEKSRHRKSRYLDIEGHRNE